MTLKQGKIATGVNTAPLTLDAIRTAVQSIDTVVAGDIVVPAGKSLIMPDAQINASVTISSVNTVFSLTINPGGSITFDGTKGRMAT